MPTSSREIRKAVAHSTWFAWNIFSALRQLLDFFLGISILLVMKSWRKL